MNYIKTALLFAFGCTLLTTVVLAVVLITLAVEDASTPVLVALFLCTALFCAGTLVSFVLINLRSFSVPCDDDAPFVKADVSHAENDHANCTHEIC